MYIIDERSSRIDDDVYISEQYKEYCLNELPIYLRAYKGGYIFRRILRRLFPQKYKKYLTSFAYNRKDLLFTLHSLRSEQNRETAIQGLEAFLKER